MKKALVILLVTVIVLSVAAVAAVMHFNAVSFKTDADTEEEMPVDVTDNFSKQYWQTGDKTLPYWLYVPDGAHKDMPLIVMLHSSYLKADPKISDEENLDNMVNTSVDDIPVYMYNGKLGALPAYVIMPQTPPASCGWAKRGEEMVALVESCCKEYGIDREWISLIGYSMGGTGALELASAYPETFRYASVVAGGLDGVTNSIIPYIKGEGRMKLSDELYPELRVPKKNDPSVYEPEKMKFAYGDKSSTVFTATAEEKAAAARFEAERIADVAQKLDLGGVNTWLLIGADDTDVSTTVSEGLSRNVGEDLLRCDIIKNCDHGEILKIFLEKKGEILEFLTK